MYRCISTTLTVGEPSDKSWHKWSSTVASWPCYPSPFPERRITYSHEVHGTQGHEQTEWRNINATWSQWEVDPTSRTGFKWTSTERLSSAIFLPICLQRNHRSSSTGTFPVIRGVSDRVGFTTKSIRFDWHNLWQSGRMKNVEKICCKWGDIILKYPIFLHCLSRVCRQQYFHLSSDT